MATWNPGDGGTDLLSLGDEGPPRRFTARAVAGAMVCLGVGAVLGIRVTTDEVATPEVVARPVLLVAGDVRDTPSCGRTCLQLPVYNASVTPVRVTVVGLDGWPDVAPSAAPVLAPSAWRLVRFDLPVNCNWAPADHVRQTTVEVRLEGRPQRQVLNLPVATPLPTELHDRLCPHEPPMRAEELTGTWFRAGDEDVWRGRQGRRLMQFDRAGDFAWDFIDPPGGEYQEMRGRYGLLNGRLTVLVDRTSPCHPGESFSWQVTMLGDGQMRLDSAPGSNGFCGASSTELWVARRSLVPQGTADSRRINPP